MQLLSILITIVLGALALAFVLYPFYRRSTAPSARPVEDAHVTRLPDGADIELAEQGAGGVLPAQTEREQAARSALREIELDYQLGNIDEADYRSLRERYVRRALVALKSRYEREQELDDSIEIQLRQLREKNDSANSN
jgi:hypothetical protein